MVIVFLFLFNSNVRVVVVFDLVCSIFVVLILFDLMLCRLFRFMSFVSIILKGIDFSK